MLQISFCIVGCADKEGDGTPGELESGNTNEVAMAFIPIPAGSFLDSYSGSKVSLGAFQLAKTETTVAQFKKCVEVGACSASSSSTEEGCTYDRGDAWKNHPMNCVDWYGAKEFCEWAGGRLPTADEWEYAATHDGTKALQTDYPWGNSMPTQCVNACYGDYKDSSGVELYWYCNGKQKGTSPEGPSAVGTYSSQGDSPLGLQDMAGNVGEWMETRCDADSDYGTVKGGSWSSDRDNLRVSNTTCIGLTDRGGGRGFRCAK